MITGRILVYLLLTAALVAAVVGGAVTYRTHVYNLGYNTAVAERKASDETAIAKRVTENASKAETNQSINEKINGTSHETIRTVTNVIYRDRVRVGPGVCGPSTPTQTETASGGKEADPGTRLVSEETERGIDEIAVAVEEGFDAGRSCQAWAKEHGYWD